MRLLHECAGADWALSRKFGCDADGLVELLVAASEVGSECGASFHVGSQQRNVDAWREPVDAH